MNYTILHCHTMLSNPTTVLDSVNSYEQYIKKAKELNMKSIAFTEHGNIFSWYNKYLECKKNGIKYIHACEVYVTKTLEKKERDNYHCILIAKNTEGMKELNYLLSHKVAFNKSDNHMYYNPRISFDELLNTSDNILILTACLGGILNSKDVELEEKFIEFLHNNKERCFLEIQPHIDKNKEQIEYNKKLLNLHLKYNIELVATNDIHYLDEEYKKGRALLQKRKKIHFENEDFWDCDFKSYENLVNCFKVQNSIPEEFYIKAIENTNKIADMIEGYNIDNSIKYPKLYDNSEKIFIEKIKKGIKLRGIEFDKYRDRINHEFKTIKNNNAIDYMLLEEDVKRWCRENDIKYGASRGSSSGSIIAYLLGITDVDSLKYDLNFERFMNPERVSLCDIDSDYEPSKRELVKEYLHNKNGLYCAEIITFNTIQEKGALKDVGGALGIDFDTMNNITKNLENEEIISKYKKEYPDLFKYSKMLEGVITSVGNHPAGTVVSPIPLDNFCSTFMNNTCNYPITQLNMKEIDKLNFVKLDILGLETIEIINDICKMANIDFLTPQNFDIEDENIYKEIHRSGIGIFQWESNTAYDYYKNLFSESTINKIKEKNNNFKYLDLLSIGNGAIRPAGASYRDELAKGIYKDNGSDVVNDYFKSTLCNCVYQEQIMGFLNKFCGFSMGESDVVRRAFAKRLGTDEFIPKIRDGFLKNSGLSEEEGKFAIDTFIKVVEDASDYLFSLNHSQVYSIIGAMCGYLRHYYTGEFLTVNLEHSKNNQDKTKLLIDYMNNFTSYKLKEVEFGKSKAKYSFDKENNTIYKGMSSIKFINSTIPEELNNIYRKNPSSFIELLKLLKDTSINSRQLDVLIKIGYFEKFGKINKLLNFVELYKMLSKKTYDINNSDDKLIKYLSLEKNDELIEIDAKIKKEDYTNEYIIKENKKTYTVKMFTTKTTYKFCEEKNGKYINIDLDNLLEYILNDLPDEDISDIEKIKYDLEFLGYIRDLPKSIIAAKVAMVSVRNRSCKMISFRNNSERWYRFKKGEVVLPAKDDVLIIKKHCKKEGYNNRTDWYCLEYEKI